MNRFPHVLKKSPLTYIRGRTVLLYNVPNLCPVIPTSNQDDRQAKNRKRGDEILIVHCCFSIIGQNLQKFKINKKNPIIYAKKHIIMLIQFKFGHILA
jgi:hypothetical protein